MANDSAAGTYDFQKRTDKSAELARLRGQAGLALGAERAMWERAGLRDGMRVLDLGCGPGLISTALAEAVPNGSVLGVDLSDELLACARANAELLTQGRVSFAQGNVYDLPCADASFDFVYARFLFQHLHDPALALRNILRVLKPGGKLCLMDVDDRFLLLAPEPPSFRAFQSAAIHAQRIEGGNREIGGDFYGLVSAAGFQDARTLVHVIRSEDCGLKNFLDVSVRFKAARLFKHPELLPEARTRAALRELDEFEKQAGAWGAIGMFVGVGTKPVGASIVNQ